MKKQDVKDPITIEADYIRETAKSYHLDCEGDLEWFAKSQVYFDRPGKELTAPRWLLNEKFPGENF